MNVFLLLFSLSFKKNLLFVFQSLFEYAKYNIVFVFDVCRKRVHRRSHKILLFFSFSLLLKTKINIKEFLIIFLFLLRWQ